MAIVYMHSTEEPTKERVWGAEGWGGAVVSPGRAGFHLQIVFVALGLLGTPGRIQAALEVAQDQAADDPVVGLLEQLLKQPQRGNANLGQ